MGIYSAIIGMKSRPVQLVNKCTNVEQRGFWLYHRNDGNIGFESSPGPPYVSGSACFTLPKYRMWRKSLARIVLWHMVELSQMMATCFRALVMATFIRLISPRKPTAPIVFDRTSNTRKNQYIIITNLGAEHITFQVISELENTANCGYKSC